MDPFEKDEVPMLSATYSQVDEHAISRSRRFSPRMRSASISIPMDSAESYEDTNVGHTGPLRSQRRTPSIQMSGPLYPNRKQGNSFQPTQAVIRRKAAEPTVEDYPSVSGIDHNDWPGNSVGKNEHLLRSGQLGMCNDPYCTTCPSYYNVKGQQKYSEASAGFDPKSHSLLYGDAKGWAKRALSFLHPYIPGIMNPHAKVVQQWNKFFVISCLVAVFLDPLFFFVLSVLQERKIEASSSTEVGSTRGLLCSPLRGKIPLVRNRFRPGHVYHRQSTVLALPTTTPDRSSASTLASLLPPPPRPPLRRSSRISKPLDRFTFMPPWNQDNKCIVISGPMTTAMVVFRSMTDLIYIFHMLLQFRLAYVAPESRVVGAGDLVDHPKKIALNYLFGFFLIDFFAVLPLPQGLVCLQDNRLPSLFSNLVSTKGFSIAD
ncbi:hypothetical protein RJ640_001816 [Escallonia rubra]|uniref:Cyclic nucleotide-gated ion channel 20, chloroplastic n=1 Tax=Escallonia rubra TaxID=112253 RepID=A0AA88Q8N1_9ASTE|nr:hypothetical protein RJ640_001816 [Escallonia rubra]